MLDLDPQTDFGEIRFESGLPGFPGACRFQLAPWGRPGGAFVLMSGMDDDRLVFVVASPWMADPEYVVDIDADTAERLGVDHPRDLAVYCMVTLGADGRAPTANLAAPIVVNRRNGRARQLTRAEVAHGMSVPLTS